MPREILLALISKVAGRYDPVEHKDLFKVLNATVKHLEWRQRDEATIRQLRLELRKWQETKPF